MTRMFFTAAAIAAIALPASAQPLPLPKDRRPASKRAGLPFGIVRGYAHEYADAPLSSRDASRRGALGVRI